ncbi:SP_1767 family glycosyltransferase [Limosilactobacillus sp. RRLNB_1_1]|uniref:SP_1767 family glycosyltransferase n=1 Tax=Limosilactobacillus albertensis TaxID=2759752 RepID=A0A7W3TT42_9LACO|nr:SP_1767 family glycosyltransferase [Limosilactobacillus albertensis]MBB1070203.1 SP_1767 family glycosyltransferase [Limosilactobacillus albertensis]MCD7119200.1 SP_1767 family glycosyltransferase [Limosilactobacillus albertensis]MCD7129408.1 SP_1767 family glycosyltransferase [Limosilactobacillus albertensis]
MKVIALSGDCGYINQIETTIKSVMAHNRNVKIYVINPDIPHEWFVNLNYYLKQVGSKVVDKKVDPGLLNQMHVSFDHISTASFGRILIPNLISEDKVLYLESDTIVDSNIDSVFDLEFGDKMIYAVPDFYTPLKFDKNGYVIDSEIGEYNTGVLLINNKKWRAEKVVDKLLEMGKNNNLANGDQTIINEFFKGQIGQLNPRYNYQIGYEFMSSFHNHILRSLKKVINPKIIHYISKQKPYKLISIGSLRKKWWSYYTLEWSDIIAFGESNKYEVKEISFDGEAFVFTNMAEIQSIEQLIKKLPTVHFNIAAYTNMAFLLLKLTQYDNVTLYPNILGKTLTKLINQANVYLDINYNPKANEVIDRVMDRKIPMVAFDRTKSQELNYDNYHVFHDGQIDEMAAAISDAIKNKTEPKSKFNIEVKDINKSLDLILESHKSVVRFGDGEFDIIGGQSIPYQTYEPALAERLKDIILRGNFNNTLVCLPDVFRDLDRYNDYAEDFYESNFFPKNNNFLMEIGKTNNWYGSTFISRPYIDLVDKSKSSDAFAKLKRLWEEKDILIVEGALTRSGVGNDLFANANSIKRIICPAKDSYQQIKQIEQAIKESAENRLVLLMLGPTAKVIVDDLQDLGNQMIDIGHIDSEYEWFKMGATHKIKLANKHTAEFNFDEEISAVHDQAYQDEIVTKIEDYR